MLGARESERRETQSLPCDKFTVHRSTEGRGCVTHICAKKYTPMQVPNAGAKEGAMLHSTNICHRPVQIRSKAGGWRSSGDPKRTGSWPCEASIITKETAWKIF